MQYEIGPEILDIHVSKSFRVKVLGALVATGDGGVVEIVPHNLVVELYIPGKKIELTPTQNVFCYQEEDRIHWIGLVSREYTNVIVEVTELPEIVLPV